MGDPMSAIHPTIGVKQHPLPAEIPLEILARVRLQAWRRRHDRESPIDIVCSRGEAGKNDERSGTEQHDEPDRDQKKRL
jgi:hypothetical protein